MSMDCRWIENNMEALYSDGLDDDTSRQARAHIEVCADCRKEVAALDAIDPLVKKYFQKQMALAVAPRRSRMSAVYGTAAAAIAATLIIAISLRAPVAEVGRPEPPMPPPIAETAPAMDAPAALKNEAEPVRAKPEPAAPADAVRPAPVTAPPADAPNFLVADPAGYSNTLDDYRGYVALIGVWSSDEPESAANIERLYKAFSSNARLRFVGVTNERQGRAGNTTFPVVYNQGSRLLGLVPGEFVLLDPNGSVEFRGSLLRDFDELRRRLAEK